jgi:hypothetical protein
MNERLPERMLVRRRRNRRHLRNDPVRKHLAVPRVVDIHRVVIEGRERGDHRRNHGHGMGVVMEAVEEAQQRFVDHRVMTDAAHERVQLAAARQLAVQHEVADLHESALRRQLLHGITAVEENACVTVDIGDAAFARRRNPESGVEREDAVFVTH